MKKWRKQRAALVTLVKEFFTRERIEHMIEAILIAFIAGLLVQLLVHLIW